jgi:selenocysteine lyase/cysteine desulfurase
MDIYQHVPSPSARRFEAGTPAVPNLYAGIAGLEIIREVGLPAISAQIRTLTDAIKMQAMRRGFRLATPADPRSHGPLIALRAHRVELLVRRLEQEGIITSSRDGNLRISPHFYNTCEDVDRLFGALDQQRDLLV